jgi:broad specificity phosphatase PhoE
MGDSRDEQEGWKRPLPRTDRPDAPLYLARYLERKAREEAAGPGPAGEAADAPGPDGEPLYLRRFRERKARGERPAPPEPVRSGPGRWTEAWLDTTKQKEIIPVPEVREAEDVLKPILDIHIVRHAETQGYSVDGGLTPMGSWQAHRRGLDLSKGIREGERVQIVSAPTARALQTGEHVLRGILDGLELWGRRAAVEGPVPLEEFRNFQVWTPSGIKDPTRAFREYHAVMERYERVALGDRPLWLVEMDRFWRLQLGGGDPIAFWMTIPMLSFEPPAHVVVRFWQGFGRLARELPEGARVICTTHSGPMRVLATWAFGHDPGEPYNTEEVRVRVRQSLKEALVTFRNRTQEVHVPPASEWPVWATAAEVEKAQEEPAESEPTFSDPT